MTREEALRVADQHLMRMLRPSGRRQYVEALLHGDRAANPDAVDAMRRARERVADRVQAGKSIQGPNNVDP